MLSATVYRHGLPPSGQQMGAFPSKLWGLGFNPSHSYLDVSCQHYDRELTYI